MFRTYQILILLIVGTMAAKEFRVGFIYNSQGPLMVDSLEAYRGVVFWVSQVNAAGGLNVTGDKWPVKLISYDVKGATTVPQLLALHRPFIQRLLSVDRVHAMIGPHTSTLTGPVLDMCNRSGVPVFTTSATSDALYNKGLPNVFGTAKLASHSSAPLMQIMRDKGVKTVAILYKDDKFPRAGALGFQAKAEAAGMEVVLLRAYGQFLGTLALSAMQSAMGEAKALQPDLLVVAGSTADWSVATLVLKTSTFTPNLAIFIGALGDRSADNMAAGEHWLVSMYWDWSVMSSASEPTAVFASNADYIARFRGFYQTSPRLYAALGSGAGEVLKIAVERSGAYDNATDSLRLPLLRAAMLGSFRGATFFSDVALDGRGANMGCRFVSLTVRDAKLVPVTSADVVYPAPWSWRPRVVLPPRCTSADWQYTVAACDAATLTRPITFAWTQPHNCSGGASLPQTVTTLQCDAVPADSSTATATVAIAVVGALVSAAVGLWLGLHRSKPLVKAAQPWMCAIIVASAGALSLSSLTLLGEHTRASCAARVWLFHLPFTLLFSCLLVKVHRVWRLFDNPRLQRREGLGAATMFKRMACLVAAEVLLLLCWTFLSPPHPVTTVSVLPGVGEVSNTACSTDSALLPLLAGLSKVALILAGCYLSFKARGLNAAFAESFHIMLALYNVAFVGGVVLLLTQSLSPSAAAATLIQTAGVTWSAAASLVCIFLPKALAVDRFTSMAALLKIASNTNTTGGGGGGGGGGLTGATVYKVRPSRAGSNTIAAGGSPDTESGASPAWPGGASSAALRQRVTELELENASLKKQVTRLGGGARGTGASGSRADSMC